MNERDEAIVREVTTNEWRPGDQRAKALAALLAEMDRLRAMERRLRQAALNDAGPCGLWAAQMIAIRRSGHE